jgi:hypothetical protein
MSSAYSSGFDRIVCITMEGRDDRRRAAEETFAGLGILPLVRFFTARRHPSGGRVGCFDSHIRVLSECLEDPACGTALVFEDDVVPTRGYSLEGVRRAADFARRMPHDEWDVLMLGYLAVGHGGLYQHPLRTPRKFASDLVSYTGTVEAEGFPGIFRHTAMMTHAVAFNRRSMQRVVRAGIAELSRRAEDVRQYDAFLSQQSFRQFCVTPMLFDQRWCMGSDNAAASKFEYVAQSMSCLAERTGAIHTLSDVRRHVPEMCAALLTAYAVFGVVAVILLQRGRSP